LLTSAEVEDSVIENILGLSVEQPTTVDPAIMAAAKEAARVAPCSCCCKSRLEMQPDNIAKMLVLNYN
jgi:hypothetical protein